MKEDTPAASCSQAEEILLSLWRENPLARDCSGCRYLQPLFGGTPFLICGYLLKSGQPRGGAPGAGGTRREEQSGV